MSMYVPRSRLFCHFESLAFFRRWGDKPCIKAAKQYTFRQLLKGTTINSQFFQKREAILTEN